MADSSIEWTTKTWNPVVGCQKVSAGCEHCYAIRVAYRNAALGQVAYQGLTRKLSDGSMNWTGVVRTLPERLREPLRWKKPARIFVDSMSDLFHKDVPDHFLDQVFAMMALCSQHTFQILTKRPERMLAHLGRGPWPATRAILELDTPTGTWPLTNVWLGVSVEDQRTADERIPLLLQTPAAVRFLSCEPLLSPIDLTHVRDAYWPEQLNVNAFRGIAWVIAGGESGAHARPMDLDWARSLRDQCQAAGVAFYFKQHGGRTHAAGGRLLDGRTYDEYPEPLLSSALVQPVRCVRPDDRS
jgi:protein gp37